MRLDEGHLVDRLHTENHISDSPKLSFSFPFSPHDARASLYKRLVYSFLVFEMLEGERVRLRSFELSDLDEIMKHWNNMELRNLVGSADRGPVARSEEEE